MIKSVGFKIDIFANNKIEFSWFEFIILVNAARYGYVVFDKNVTALKYAIIMISKQWPVTKCYELTNIS